MNGLIREKFDADETVFQQDDCGDCAYVIESGSVEVLVESVDEQKRVAILLEGAMFGEVALLDKLPRSATVRTLKPSILVRIDRSHVEELLGRADPVIQYLLRIMLERFRNSAGAGQGSVRGTLPVKGSLQFTAVNTLSVAHDLADGIDANRLTLYYQPIVRLPDRQLVGFEALVRWQHPTQGLINPDEFIPLAEKTGLIHRLGEWVMKQATSDWRNLRQYCAEDSQFGPVLSVNLSASELSLPQIVPAIQAYLSRQKMLPAELQVELTEAVVINDLELVANTINGLRQLGIGIALDDFGKGYAGLDYLQTLPFSCIKLDKSFVDQMHASERSYQILKSAIDLSRQLELSTVAEGIEDEATASSLYQMGCRYVQGFHYARPMPLQEIEVWFNRRLNAIL